jgi:hypothetical protein
MENQTSQFNWRRPRTLGARSHFGGNLRTPVLGHHETVRRPAMGFGLRADLVGGQRQVNRVGMGLGHVPRRVAVALDPVAVDVVEIERLGVPMGDNPVDTLPSFRHPAIKRLQVFERIHHEGNLLGDHLILFGAGITRFN